MKKFLSYFVLMFCCVATVSAQQTSLVVDNQTPGWLSSKIPFVDQATVKHLKVTGYLNGTDLNFIYELSELRELVHLDLSDANIVAGGDNSAQDNVWTKGILYVYGNDSRKSGTFLAVPKSIIKVEDVDNVDTLVIGGESLPVIDTRWSGNNKDLIYFREGVESISNSLYIYADKVHLPTTLKRIGIHAFYDGSGNSYTIGTIDVNLPSSIEDVAEGAFGHLYIKDDTIRLPNKMETWNTCSFVLREGQVVYIPQNVKEINNASTENTNSNISSTTELEIYVESKIPPTVRHFSTELKAFESCIVHVPAGCADVYKNAEIWKYATIVEEEIPVTGISITKADENVYVGDKVKLDVTVIPENANNKNFTLKSLNEDVATIDEQGNVIAKAYGKARIMATSEDGEFTDICEFDVFEHVTGVNINSSSLNLKIGEKKTLEAIVKPEGKTDGQIRWSSSDAEVAEVDDNGAVTAKAKGPAIITATTVDGGYTASCEVRVYQPVTSLDLNIKSLTLNTGEAQQLIATVLPVDADNKNVIWTSEDETIAKVDDTGKVTGIKAGQVWIYAESEDEGYRDGCLVTVNQPVTGLELNKSSITFNQIGDTEQLTATVLPEDATNKDVAWSSSNQSVAIVSNGLVVCSGFGTAVIYATTVDGGFMATCVVNATEASGIDNVSMEKNIQVGNGRISLRGLAAGTKVVICDTAGRVLYSTTVDASGNADISNLGRGIFIVKIGEHTYKNVL